MNGKIALHCMKAYSEHYNEMCEECDIYGQTGSDHCFEDALQYAIESVEKLEQIKEKLQNYGFDRSWEVMKKICEVVDGK